jgi:Family of unknown function (DUF5675)
VFAGKNQLNIKLERMKYLPDGIFSVLTDESGNQIAVGLEHVYTNGITLTAKVAPGTYTCTRHAPNRLPYETFELQNVPDFQGKPVTGILIHILNYDSQSEGCIGVGEAIADSPQGKMITNSKITFERFMKLQQGVNSFTLEIG